MNHKLDMEFMGKLQELGGGVRVESDIDCIHWGPPWTTVLTSCQGRRAVSEI